MGDPFAGLVSSGDPGADVDVFLLATGRADTLAHCRAVAGQARSLARRFRVDEQKAVLAARCHDLAAVVRQDRAIAVAEGLGILPDEVQRAVPMLLHGPIAAAVLSLKLGVVDSDVLNAIRYHTTCRAGASALELVVN